MRQREQALLGDTIGAVRAICLLTLALCSGALAAEPEVIVHRQLQQNDVSRALLRGIFGMRVRTWADGTPTRVFVLKDENPTHVAFCKNVLKSYPYQLRLGWDRLVYSGTGQPPIMVADVEEMRRSVSTTPGGIGYLPGDTVDTAATELKVLNVR